MPRSAPKPNEPRYDVIWPLSRKAVKRTAAAPRLPDLNGKIIAEVWDAILRGDQIYPLVRAHIKARFPRAQFVSYGEFGNFHGAREREVIAALPAKLRAHKVDAAIVGVGA